MRRSSTNLLRGEGYSSDVCESAKSGKIKEDKNVSQRMDVIWAYVSQMSGLDENLMFEKLSLIALLVLSI